MISGTCQENIRDSGSNYVPNFSANLAQLPLYVNKEIEPQRSEVTYSNVV